MNRNKMKMNNRRPFFGRKPAKRSILVKGEWKAVDLDPCLFSEEGMEGMVCFEELTNYQLMDANKAAMIAAKREKKKAKKRKAQEEAGVEDTEGEKTTGPAKKKAKKKKPAAKESDKSTEMTEEKPTEDEASKAEAVPSKDKVQSKTKKKKKQKPQATDAEPSSEHQTLQTEKKGPLKKQRKNWTNTALCASDDTNADVSAWKDLFVPPPVLKALSCLGFGSPTPIQALALPPAIRDRMDILGAAETGDGKTLAFSIPMIHTILEWKNGSEKRDDDAEPPSTVESLHLPAEDGDTGEQGDCDSAESAGEDDEQDVEESHDDDEPGCVEVIDFADFDPATGATEKHVGGQSRPLLGLVLMPTRELAVQVKHHIDAIAKFTDIKTAIVLGGMAQQKQRRMLNRRPEIIIATPGRLWDLIKEKHPHLLNLRQLQCLVIDEADRMVERGHFAELENLLEMLNTTFFNPKRQTFVFSATLTMAHSLPSRFLQKKKKKLDQRNKLEVLMEKVGITSKPKVIDLTRKEATVETLTETRIHCQKEEKDFYLYYFLMQYPGRTMVFANSIDCIKRLHSLLIILDCTPLPLHANMHQKQRLKNLERFAERESCVLLTTDVAARGLDIPDVQHVIHYQVPRTSETYVHRSGRTARATKEGLSLLLIGPDDLMNFRKIYKTLGKDEDLPMFPIESKCMDAIKERVNLARNIEKIEFYNNREKQHNSWFKQAAEALELDLDDDLLLGTARGEDADRGQQKMVKKMKQQLKHLISQPVFKNRTKTKYPTQLGKLPVPRLPVAGMESAITSVTTMKKVQEKSSQPQGKRLKKEKRKAAEMKC
ncbi:ATP-dependent RNA helicase DDX24 [Betta splendens]|uniref:ATP-dependent RNA helicase n=1 Tax=Betta splendens TaxID=158456 RepID=A0A9W2XIL3_BETSP|nr:ATP-dependent RNA helicase DDX24 [Betta splendens]